MLQDNVFVNVVASVQYRALADKASDAFYKLSNTRSQIQAYVFDGMNWKLQTWLNLWKWYAKIHALFLWIVWLFWSTLHAPQWESYSDHGHQIMATIFWETNLGCMTC